MNREEEKHFSEEAAARDEAGVTRPLPVRAQVKLRIKKLQKAMKKA